MRVLSIALLCLLAAGALPAEAGTPSPVTSTAAVFASNPPVTPDPSFGDPGYASKWPHITVEEAQRLQGIKGTVFADGRSRMEWEQSHIKGALALPLGEFDQAFAKEEKNLRRARIIVAYCHGKGCHLADGLAQRLLDKGLKNVAVFWGGYPEWHDKRLPLVDKNGKKVAEPSPAAAQ